jgi:acyl carrier protein
MIAMDIHEFMKSSILELNDIDEDRLVPELTLEELALDSLDYVEIQLLIKRKYKVEVYPGLFTSGQLKTLGDLFLYIEVNQVKNIEQHSA